MSLPKSQNQKNRPKTTLIAAWNAGVDSVKGDICVLDVLNKQEIGLPDVIMAVGKAASSMTLGALRWFQSHFPEAKMPQVIVVTKYGHVDAELSRFENITIIESGHPIPDLASLKAGDLLLKKLKEMPAESQLLFLVSGGASALAEKLADGIDLDFLQGLNQKMLADGSSIEQINKLRGEYSKLKNGKLLANFCGEKLDVIYISDVQGDALETIGSGIGSPVLLEVKNSDCSIDTYLGGSNHIARQAVETYFLQREYSVIVNEEILYDDVFELSKSLVEKISNGAEGVYIFGGEPTIKLPDSPGQGGRNQSLALAIALEINGMSNVTCLVAGTDGTDGPTTAAGGIVDGRSGDDKLYAEQCLQAANAGVYLKKYNGLFVSGPTGTNVMDIVIVMVSSSQ